MLQPSRFRKYDFISVPLTTAAQLLLLKLEALLLWFFLSSEKMTSFPFRQIHHCDSSIWFDASKTIEIDDERFQLSCTHLLSPPVEKGFSWSKFQSNTTIQWRNLYKYFTHFPLALFDIVPCAHNKIELAGIGRQTNLISEQRILVYFRVVHSTQTHE